MSTGLDDFLRQVKRFPLLTAEEEILLARRIQAMVKIQQDNPNGEYTAEERITVKRGKRALDRMVCANVLLVVSIARKHWGHVKKGSLHLDIEELIQEGILGVHRACLKFDPERGYKFSSYAYNWIRQFMVRAILNKGRLVRVPHDIGEAMLSNYSKQMELQQQLGRHPTRAELADALKISVSQLDHALAIGNAKPISLDAPMAKSGDPLIETIIDEDREDHLERLNRRMELNQIMEQIQQLPPNNREALIRCYGLDGEERINATELAKEKGMCRQSIRDRVLRAERLLRQSLAA
jgi:RNA polymerase sigma factor (sigma-70 family)